MATDFECKYTSAVRLTPDSTSGRKALKFLIKKALRSRVEFKQLNCVWNLAAYTIHNLL